MLSLAEAKIRDTTTRAVCRKLSAIGRRVLSIESVAPFQGITALISQTVKLLWLLLLWPKSVILIHR